MTNIASTEHKTGMARTAVVVLILALTQFGANDARTARIGAHVFYR